MAVPQAALPVLAKVLEKLPLDAAKLVVGYLKEPHPTAVLISQLTFKRDEDDCLTVSGPGLRQYGDRYGVLTPVSLNGSNPYAKCKDDYYWWIEFDYSRPNGKPRTRAFLHRRPGDDYNKSVDEIRRWSRYI
jgi:hypothetical protein